MDKTAVAALVPVRQRTQYTCVPCSLMMCLKALGMDWLDEDIVNDVMGARPMKGATWEQVVAAAQHFGKRATLTAPCTIEQLKEWTDQGIPVMIGWNPEGRDWSHASVVFDVSYDGQQVTVADPNMPNPNEMVRVLSAQEFYSKWYEKFPNYLVRRPACAISNEVSESGHQLAPPFMKMASRLVDTYLGISKQAASFEEIKEWVLKAAKEDDDSQLKQVLFLAGQAFDRNQKQELANIIGLAVEPKYRWATTIAVAYQDGYDYKGKQAIDKLIKYMNMCENLLGLPLSISDFMTGKPIPMTNDLWSGIVSWAVWSLLSKNLSSLDPKKFNSIVVKKGGYSESYDKVWVEGGLKRPKGLSSMALRKEWYLKADKEIGKIMDKNNGFSFFYNPQYNGRATQWVVTNEQPQFTSPNIGKGWEGIEAVKDKHLKRIEGSLKHLDQLITSKLK